MADTKKKTKRVTRKKISVSKGPLKVKTSKKVVAGKRRNVTKTKTTTIDSKGNKTTVKVKRKEATAKKPTRIREVEKKKRADGSKYKNVAKSTWGKEDLTMKTKNKSKSSKGKKSKTKSSSSYNKTDQKFTSEKSQYNKLGQIRLKRFPSVGTTIPKIKQYIRMFFES